MKTKNKILTSQGEQRIPLLQRASTLSATLFAGLLMVVPEAFAGHGVGTGGDHVRGTFIKVGLSVIEYLDSTERGQSILAKAGLESRDLQGTLNINVIDVSTDILIDNTGSVVDALGTPGHIILSRDAWLNHFEMERDVYFLVFHELLRALSVNDDNYVLSMALNPFPLTRRVVTKIETKFPLLGEPDLASIIPPEKMKLEGSGCPSALGGSFLDLDTERNQVAITFQKFDIVLGQASSGRKSCSLVMAVNPPNGSRVVVTQSDFSAKILAKSELKVAVAQSVSLGGRITTPTSKTVEVPSSTNGRILVRANNGLASNCQGTPELLRITTSATAMGGETSEKAKGAVLGERVLLSVRIESCSTSERFR
jgi:hypothetical protein